MTHIQNMLQQFFIGSYFSFFFLRTHSHTKTKTDRLKQCFAQHSYGA